MSIHVNMIRRHKLTRDTFEEKDIYASEESSAKKWMQETDR